MKINHSANFTDFDEFMTILRKLEAEGKAFNFSGNVSANENDNDNFNINWTSDEEV